MAGCCSACQGPLPPHGAYTVTVSLPASSPRSSRLAGTVCGPQCLAELAGKIADAAARRDQRRGRDDLAALMCARPKGR